MWLCRRWIADAGRQVAKLTAVAFTCPTDAPRAGDRPGLPNDNRWQDSCSKRGHGNMKIDIDRLTEVELIDLNHRIVARLRLISQMRAHSDMMEFRIGDRVAFQPPGQGRVEGMLTRYNRKTVTVIADNGRQWNVSPNFLSKVLASDTARNNGSNVVLLTKG